jgi:pimeloyl-ACP methyl ester carboxylesterase
MPFVVANGIRTRYEVAGEGPPVLLIAGNGMDHTTFRDQLPLFARNFRCITYDMRGIGDSDVPEDGYTVPVMAADALALLTALDVPAAHVGGYSLGGAIALEMALSDPERVNSLSLYSTYSHVEPFLRRRYELLIKILLETPPELWAMFTAVTAYGEEYINAHDEEIEQEVTLRTARWSGPRVPSKTGMLGHYHAILSHDVRDRLSEIGCPTWIAVGLSDPVTPVGYARLMHERITGARLKVYGGAPHRLLNFTPQFTRDAHDFLLSQLAGKVAS